jgi:hypothetical protein
MLDVRRILVSQYVPGFYWINAKYNPVYTAFRALSQGVGLHQGRNQKKKKKKKIPVPMSLSRFYKNPSFPKFPLDIAESESNNETICKRVSLERIDSLVKRRSHLICEADMDKHGLYCMYMLLVVTYFDRKASIKTVRKENL